MDASAPGADTSPGPVDGAPPGRVGDPLSSWVAAAGGWGAGLCLAGIVGASALQVCFRYVLNAPLPWPEEVSSLLLVWLTYVGALVLPESRLHVAIDALYGRLPPAARRGADLLTDLLGVGFHGILVVAGLRLAAVVDGIRLPALQLPLSLLIGVLPVAAALQVYLHAAAAVRRLRGAAGPPGGQR